MHHDDSLIKSIHLPDKEDLMKFSKANSAMIISELIPMLFQATDGMVTKIKKIAYSDEYEKWSNHEYQEGTLRKVVEIVKWAMCEMIAIEPQRVFAIANQPEYSDVLVRNELILSAFQSAPITYADDIIKWMILDFPGHLFDFTSNQVNLLSSAKKVLSIHSHQCSTELFSSLENLICTWHEPSEQMVQTYQHRVDVNRKKEWSPVYYTYWGHLQKELLPHLSLDRLSSYSRELIHVLEIATHGFIQVISTQEVGTVVAELLCLLFTDMLIAFLIKLGFELLTFPMTNPGLISVSILMTMSLILPRMLLLLICLQ